MSSPEVKVKKYEIKDGAETPYILVKGPYPYITLIKEIAAELEKEYTVVKRTEVIAADGYNYKIRLFI